MHMMTIDLAGMDILVTGGSSGIGEEISRCLAEAGARVAIHYNSHENQAKALAKGIGNGCGVFKADLSDPSAAAVLFEEVVKEFGKVDVLVNNAGTGDPSPVLIESDRWLENWNNTIAVNLTSAGMLCHAAIRHFSGRGGGRIINIASRAAFRGETEDFLAYAASKGGMVSLSRSIARSFGKKGIKSFVIAPGWVRTPMAEGKIDESSLIAGELALGEMTLPGHIAPMVAFFASGLLDHATGCTVDINAGSYMH